MRDPHAVRHPGGPDQPAGAASDADNIAAGKRKPADGTTPAPTPSTVILLHGFAGFAMLNRPLTLVLRHAGYRPVEIGYDSWGQSLVQICDHLEPWLDRLDGDGTVHIVAHSMGGLVTRALIHRHRPARLGKVVMLGTPNGGSEIADFLDRTPWLRPVLGHAAPALITQRPAMIDAMFGPVDYDLGIIAGSRPLMPGAATRLLPTPSDGKVSVASTRLAGAADHIILPLSHSMLPYHAMTHRQVRHFLDHGRFIHPA
ncbi:MAG TPA: alpha/beta hydrolase [Sphingobium sp.]|nr:alpha/beta hydrolase [Sphingobium sp.]